STKQRSWVWLRRLTVTDFISGWRENVFHTLNVSIMKRACRTIIYDSQRVQEHHSTRRHHWYERQLYTTRSRELSRLHTMKREYAREKEQAWIRTCKQNETV